MAQSSSHTGALDVNEVFRGGGRSVEFLDRINQASIVMLAETGLVGALAGLALVLAACSGSSEEMAPEEAMAEGAEETMMADESEAPALKRAIIRLDDGATAGATVLPAHAPQDGGGGFGTGRRTWSGTLQAWSRRAEITCDRAALLSARDLEVTLRALVKTELGLPQAGVDRRISVGPDGGRPDRFLSHR